MVPSYAGDISYPEGALSSAGRMEARGGWQSVGTPRKKKDAGEGRNYVSKEIDA